MSDQTLIATAISEISRNIVKFADAGRGDGLAGVGGRAPGDQCGGPRRRPGIADPEEALQDGYSTYHGLGLGLPGAKRLMDRFHLMSIPGDGTTVTMEKWLR